MAVWVHRSWRNSSCGSPSIRLAIHLLKPRSLLPPAAWEHWVPQHSSQEAQKFLQPLRQVVSPLWVSLATISISSLQSLHQYSSVSLSHGTLSYNEGLISNRETGSCLLQFLSLLTPHWIRTVTNGATTWLNPVAVAHAHLTQQSSTAHGWPLPPPSLGFQDTALSQSPCHLHAPWLSCSLAIFLFLSGPVCVHSPPDNHISSKSLKPVMSPLCPRSSLNSCHPPACFISPSGVSQVAQL